MASARRKQTAASDGSAIRNLRLVDTVEHSRVFAEESERDIDAAPVAQDLLIGTDADDVTWSKPAWEPVFGRNVAPVFDLRVPDPDAVDAPVTVTGRLLDGETVLREKTAQLAPEAVAGVAPDRRRDLEEAFGADVPDRLPLLETLVADPDYVDGEYPIFPAAPETRIEIEVAGEALDAPATDQVWVHGTAEDSTPALGYGETTMTLTVGVVGLAGERPGLDSQYRFGDDADLTAFADDVADHLLDVYPVSTVETVVLDERQPGFDFVADAHSAAVRAERAVRTRTGPVRTARYRVGGDRTDDVTVGHVNCTIGVVPGDFFDDTTDGVLPRIADRPYARAVLVEYGTPTAAAHELGHFFLSWYYAHPELGDGGFGHAPTRLRSTGFDLGNGDLTVSSSRQSALATPVDGWMDTYTYEGLATDRFESEAEPFYDSATRVLDGFLGWIRELERLVGHVSVDHLAEVDVDPEALHTRLGELESDLSDVVEAVDYDWEEPSVPADLWSRIEAAGEDANELGGDVRPDEVTFVEDTTETLRTISRRFGFRGHLMADEAARYGHGQSESDDPLVEYAMFLTGRLTAEDVTVDGDVVPVIGSVEDVDGEGDVVSLDASGESVGHGEGSTRLASIAAGGSGDPPSGAFAASVELPQDAVEVELTLEPDDGETRTVTIDAITHPIRRRIEALPDRAVTDDGARDRLLETLDSAGQQARNGDYDAAASTLRDLHGSVDSSVVAGYQPETPDEPALDELFARIGQQVQRFGREVPELARAGSTGDAEEAEGTNGAADADDVLGARASEEGDDGLPTSWLLGGAAAVAAAGYLFTRVYGGGADGSPPNRPQ